MLLVFHSRNLVSVHLYGKLRQLHGVKDRLFCYVDVQRTLRTFVFELISTTEKFFYAIKQVSCAVGQKSSLVQMTQFNQIQEHSPPLRFIEMR